MEDKDLKPRLINILDVASIELYNSERSHSYTSENIDELTESFDSIKQLFPSKDVLIVGEINKGYPIFYGEAAGNACKVFSMDPTDGQQPLIPIANDLSQLKGICDYIDKTFDRNIHKVNSSGSSLDKTPENTALRKLTLAEIEKVSPDADLSYWDYILFKYLTLYMS